MLTIVVGSMSGACSTSVLVRPDDHVFQSAQERLAATSKIVDELAPSPPDRVLFMQAESLYRYRFEQPHRSLLGYLVEGAAEVVELPALQALAGSLDLADLRLRMYDGAVQLWETLLSRSPTSSLRPLVLYRLGWAYRCVGVNGLPRESGNEAFDALISEQAGTRLATLAQEGKQAPWKSKDAATALSIIPGLGQFYVGEPLNGALRLAVALAAVALVAVPIAIASNNRDDLSWSRDWSLLAIGTGGLIVLSMDYTASYQDAVRGVVDYNERVENAFYGRHPDSP